MRASDDPNIFRGTKMSAPEQAIEQTPKPQLTKEELERKKIELEIKDLERPFWKRPVYVLAALPTLLAVVTLSVGLFNGYFSASLTKLENQKHDLEVEVKQFQARRTELHTENEELRKEKGTLEARIKQLQMTSEGQVTILEKKRLELEEISNTLSQQNENLLAQKRQLENTVVKMQSDFSKIYAFTDALDKAIRLLPSEEERSVITDDGLPGVLLGRPKLAELKEILLRMNKRQKR